MRNNSTTPVAAGLTTSSAVDPKASMTRPASLTTLPAEILLEIFEWANWDEVNLNLLQVSKHIRSVLLLHPWLGALGVFSMEETQDRICMVAHAQGDLSLIAKNRQLRRLCPARDSTIENIMNQPWCRESALSQIQKALARRLIRNRWTPYLQRDQRLRKSGDLIELLSRVSALWQSVIYEGDEDRMSSIPDTLTGYVWTRLDLWPLKGRIIIRDQVSNSCEQLDLPIVTLFSYARNSHLTATKVKC